MKNILIVFSFCFVKSFSQQEFRQPNVILILTDDQGYGDVSCHGNPLLKTPSIDALYNESVSLSDFHVDPTCAPTRAALMTGKYSARVGTWMTYMGRHHMNKDQKTMADVFSENGYNTAIFGKWHLGDNYPFRPQDRGFKESLVHGGGVIGETPDYWGNNYYDDTYFRNGEPEKVQGYCTDVWFKETTKHISKSTKEKKPFFVYLPLNAPHGPLHVPEKYVKPYKNNKEILKKQALFYGMIASIDENLEKLRTYLEEEGVSKNTILLFVSDNGTSSGVHQKVKKTDKKVQLSNSYGFNAGMRGKKGMPYEGGHRTICMFHWPKGKLTNQQNVPTLTAHIDLFPTLMKLAKLKTADKINFDGTDISKLLYNPKSRHLKNRTLFVHDQTQFGQKLENDFPIKYKEYVVMKNKWRLVGEELYDLSIDPSQTEDISDGNPKIKKELKKSYEDWWEDISKNFNIYNRTIIGSAYQKETRLDAQSWHGEFSPYNQQHVRSGMEANGFWDLEIAQKGNYILSLRRWPRELNKAVRANVEPQVFSKGLHDMSFRLNQLKSTPIDVISAKIKIGEIEMILPVEEKQKEVQFEVTLEKGNVNLQTWFIDASEKEWGAYYVYINKKLDKKN